MALLPPHDYQKLLDDLLKGSSTISLLPGLKSSGFSAVHHVSTPYQLFGDFTCSPKPVVPTTVNMIKHRTAGFLDLNYSTIESLFAELTNVGKKSAPVDGGYNYADPPRKGEKWYTEEIEFLIECFEAGDDAATLARKHQRSIGAVLSRLVASKRLVNYSAPLNNKFSKECYKFYYPAGGLFADIRKLKKLYDF